MASIYEVKNVECSTCGQIYSSQDETLQLHVVVPKGAEDDVVHGLISEAVFKNFEIHDNGIMFDYCYLGEGGPY